MCRNEPTLEATSNQMAMVAGRKSDGKTAPWYIIVCGQAPPVVVKMIQPADDDDDGGCYKIKILFHLPAWWQKVSATVSTSQGQVAFKMSNIGILEAEKL